MRSFLLCFLLAFILIAESSYSLDYVAGEARIRLKKGASITDISDHILNQPEAMVPYSRSFTKKYIEGGLNNQYYTDKKAAEKLKIEEPLLRTYRVKIPSDVSPAKYCLFLRTLPAVEIAEPIVKEKLMYRPNDQRISSQAHLEKHNIFTGWDFMKGDPSVVIGISDNGVDNAHEDLLPNIALNMDEIPDNKIDDDGNGYVDDYSGVNFTFEDDKTNPSSTYVDSNHGTEVAGIAAAATNNSLGVAGVGFNCRLFPMKTSKINDAEFIEYGYESIIYAAQNGIKVLNLSWGSQYSYSEINQSVVDYAVANDVALVASAGNPSGSGLSALAIEPFYPPGYRGVLGVSDVGANGAIQGTSAAGTHARIAAVAPNFTTRNNDGYGWSNGGSSFASPVVAGAVGLIRAKYPELNPLQAIEFTRKFTSDIWQFNPGWEDFVPRMLDMSNTEELQPFDSPGINIIKVSVYDLQDVPVERLKPGEEYIVKILAANYLGAGSNISFKIKNIWDFSESVEILADSVFKQAIGKNSSFMIENFKIKIINEDHSRIMFRMDIKGDNDYADAAHFYLFPSSSITTFENGAIKFSVSDLGRFGFSSDKDEKEGAGFIIKGETSGLSYSGGLVASAEGKSISANFGSGVDGNDFIAVKKFEEPDKHTGIVSDQNAFDPLNIQIKQTFFVPAGYKKYTRVKLSLSSVNQLQAPAVGYYLDWDVAPSSSQNITGLLPQALPSGLSQGQAAARYISSLDNLYAFGSAVFTLDASGTAQTAAFTYSDTPLENEDIIAALSNGVSLQDPAPGDLNYIMGMQKKGVLNANEEFVCYMCIGGGFGKEDLAASLKECVQSGLTSVDNPEEIALSVYPNPAATKATVSGELKKGAFKVRVLNILGIEVLPETEIKNAGVFSVNLNIENLAPALYLINITDGLSSYTKELIIKK